MDTNPDAWQVCRADSGRRLSTTELIKFGIVCTDPDCEARHVNIEDIPEVRFIERTNIVRGEN